MNTEDHRKAIAAAIEAAIEAASAGDWHHAHGIVQRLDDPLACWIHAILHKIEGDAGNARYWYAQSAGRRYEEFADPQAELRAALREAESDRSDGG